jgi:hypothetical protein
MRCVACRIRSMDKRRCRCRLPARSRWTNCWLTRPKRASLGPAPRIARVPRMGSTFVGQKTRAPGCPNRHRRTLRRCACLVCQCPRAKPQPACKARCRCGHCQIPILCVQASAVRGSKQRVPAPCGETGALSRGAISAVSHVADPSSSGNVRGLRRSCRL